MRPLWFEFPEDENSFDEEREWLVGSSLLVRPVLHPDLLSVSLYLPGKQEAWYEWDTHRMHVSPGAVYGFNFNFVLLLILVMLIRLWIRYQFINGAVQ